MPETLFAPEQTKTYGGSFDRQPNTPQSMLRRQYNEYDVPVYKLIKPFFSGDQGGAYHHEGSIISFDGIPNETMEPMNDLAESRMERYLRSLPPVVADVPRLKDGRMPELGDILEAMTKQLRPPTPQPLPESAGGAKERVMAALAAGLTADPKDLAELAGAKPIEMPRSADVPAMTGVELDGPVKRGPGRPPKHPVGTVALPSAAPQPAVIMGSVKMDNSGSMMDGPNANLSPGTRVSQG